MDSGTLKSDEEKARHDRRAQLKALNLHSAGTPRLSRSSGGITDYLVMLSRFQKNQARLWTLLSNVTLPLSNAYASQLATTTATRY